MSNESTAVAEAPAPKAAKPRAAKKAKKTARATSKNGLKLLKPHRQVLRQLYRGDALTRRKIATKAGRVDDLYNDRIANETKTYEFLEKQGLIKVSQIDIDGKAETVNTITAAGKKAYDTAK